MAVKAPKVQTLAQAMADLNPAYAASRNVVNKQISGLGAKYDAQRSATNAERGQGFAAINNQATGRGGSFSGIPIDEQSTYLATKYLPGMQQADYQQNQEGLTLKGQLADINKEQRLQAVDTRQKQKSDLNSWNSARAAEAAAAREAAKQRRFTAAQSAADRAFRASQAAASRAFSASQQAASQGPSNSQIIGKLNNWASKRWGGDKKLSPSDFKAGFQQAAKYGMDRDTYVAVMQRYVNNSHAKDYAF